jgi:hypothetical protein
MGPARLRFVICFMLPNMSAMTGSGRKTGFHPSASFARRLSAAGTNAPGSILEAITVGRIHMNPSRILPALVLGLTLLVAGPLLPRKTSMGCGIASSRIQTGHPPLYSNRSLRKLAALRSM